MVFLKQEHNEECYYEFEICNLLYICITFYYFIGFIKRCRICTDCGSRTPGGGSSSRWHSHYTICDSCYQQRNKGFSCPICQKAYRAAAYKEMVKCSWCHK